MELQIILTYFGVNKITNMAEYKTYQMYAPENLSKRIESQSEFKELKLSASKTLIILVTEALNAREKTKKKDKTK